MFGWTADEATSFRLLDAFVDAGFNLIIPPIPIRAGYPATRAVNPSRSSGAGSRNAAAMTTW